MLTVPLVRSAKCSGPALGRELELGQGSLDVAPVGGGPVANAGTEASDRPEPRGRAVPGALADEAAGGRRLEVVLPAGDRQPVVGDVEREPFPWLGVGHGDGRRPAVPRALVGAAEPRADAGLGDPVEAAPPPDAGGALCQRG